VIFGEMPLRQFLEKAARTLPSCWSANSPEIGKTCKENLLWASADVISCSTRTQAEEVLARQEVDLVFCDEYLPDGSYSDLIHSNHWNHKIPRVVVATRHGD
jgi:DNA-binding NtrC family response regulator